MKMYIRLFSAAFLFFHPEKSFAQCTPAVNGNSYYVNTQSDFAAGSLRAAIMAANTDNVGGTIFINTGDPLYLTAPLPAVTCDSLLVLPTYPVTIDGNGIVNEPGITINALHSCLGTQVSGINFTGTTFSVTNTNDAGAGSLRQAITSSNFSSSSDAIHFNIPGQAPHRIQVNSAFPTIRKPLSIDGSTQPANGYTGSAPKIELDGMGGTFIALDFDYTPNIHLYNASLYGMYIHSFGAGISTTLAAVFNCGALNKGNVISGNITGISNNSDSIFNITYNFIGTDTSGTIAEGNSTGINTLSGFATSQHYINYNVISGCTTGVRVFAPSYNYTFKGNYVGTDKTGSYAIPNIEWGIDCSGSNATYGGINPGDGNLFSGNCPATLVGDQAALRVGPNSVIIGNKFGTNLAGTAAIPNPHGVAIDCIGSGHNFRIGGATAAERNIVSSSAGGILTYASQGLIKNNYIGTDVTGTVSLPNTGDGVMSYGDSVKIEDNLIVGNFYGVLVVADRDTVIHNTIYNSVNEGIYNYGMFNWFTHDSIYDNGAKGIYNYNNANNGIQKPVITACTSSGLAGTALPFASIEIFYSQSINSFPQGKTYISTVTANAAGNWNYSGSISDPVHVTATQTDANHNTSEFADLPISTGMQNIEGREGILIYPNPVREEVTIYGLRFTISKIEIHNLFGEKIVSNTLLPFSPGRRDLRDEATLNVSGLPSGIYFVTITDEKQNRVTSRFVKM